MNIIKDFPTEYVMEAILEAHPLFAKSFSKQRLMLSFDLIPPLNLKLKYSGFMSNVSFILMYIQFFLIPTKQEGDERNYCDMKIFVFILKPIFDITQLSITIGDS